MKYSPYSFSKLNTHKQCNRRFKYNYIDKAPKSDFDKTALFKGSAIHSILEHYPGVSSHKLAPKYLDLTNKFIQSELGQKYLNQQSSREVRIALNDNLQPQEYNKNALFRGSVDYVGLIDGILHLCDYKSGKYKELKYQEFDQLMFYAVYFFVKYSKVQKIKISYVYVEHDSENDILLERKYLNNYIKELNDSILSAENDEDFNKNITKLCEWCPFQEHCASEL